MQLIAEVENTYHLAINYTKIENYIQYFGFLQMSLLRL